MIKRKRKLVAQPHLIKANLIKSPVYKLVSYIAWHQLDKRCNHKCAFFVLLDFDRESQATCLSDCLPTLLAWGPTVRDFSRLGQTAQDFLCPGQTVGRYRTFLRPGAQNRYLAELGQKRLKISAF